MRTPAATRNALILKQSMEIDMEMALRMRNRVCGLRFGAWDLQFGVHSIYLEYLYV